MDTNTEQNNLDALLIKGRKDTKQILLLLVFTFLSLGVSLFLGINNNIPSAISSLLLILAFSKLAEYNHTETENKLYHKYFWVSYLLAGVMFVFAVKSYLSSYTLFDDMFGQALMYIAFGVYFVCYRPSRTGIVTKLLKLLGYILLGLSVLSSYMASTDYLGDAMICVSMFVFGIILLYISNRSYLKKLFQA